MSVAYDNVGPSSSGTGTTAGTAAWTTFSLSWSHTVGSGSNTLIVVGATFSPYSGDTATLSATCNGTAMNIASSVEPNNTSGVGVVYLFYLANPPAGNNSIVVTATYSSGTKSSNDALVGGSISFTGVNQSTPLQNIATNYGSGTSASLNVTSTSGDMVVDVIGDGSGTTSSNQTLRWKDNYGGNGAAENAAQSTAAGASSVSMGYAIANDYWGMVGMDIVAAGGAAFQPDEDFPAPVLPPAAVDPAVTLFS